jgi:hypothetical protein
MTGAKEASREEEGGTDWCVPSAAGELLHSIVN